MEEKSVGDVKYLYGAAVQGIQGFIFQTNELKDIVGASELVEEICTTAFDEFGGSKENSIIRAAGNIKHIFTNKAVCETAVRKFPKKVMTMAPGITISQAVVPMVGKFESFENAVEKLESRLRAQRNKPMRSITMGLIGVLRSRKTGLPVYRTIDDEYLDEATFRKRYIEDKKVQKEYRKRTTKNLCKKSFNIENINDNRIAYDIEEITKHNDWIAIIHADGNGLGQIVSKIGTDEDQLKDFSTKLDEATVTAANLAYEAVVEKYEIKENEIIPIRPIVLGGDDFTAICRGDIALFYVSVFLKQFEIQSKLLLENKIKMAFGERSDKLTSCAGVAFIKSSYPFYYGYDLAESLCDIAKKDAKKEENKENGLAPSCLMFHKVQDSFVVDFDEIAKRELTPIKDKVSFEYGPYYLKEKDGRMSLDDLMFYPIVLSTKEGNAIKSNLREWMTILYDKKLDAASLKCERIETILSSSARSIFSKLIKYRTDGERCIYPVYDVLSLCSIINQVTKAEEK